VFCVVMELLNGVFLSWAGRGVWEYFCGEAEVNESEWVERKEELLPLKIEAGKPS
jgi:hypothetical protein